MSLQTHLDLRLFGSFEARLDGSSLPRPRARRDLWLLAILALRAGRDVDRSWLAGVLWPDSPEDVALANLRRSLTALRQALGPAAARLTRPTPRALRLETAGAAIDVRDFDAAITRGDAASLEQAVTLYRGALLEDCKEEWVVPERARCEQAYLGALEELARRAARRGDAAAAIRHLRRLLAADPFQEAAHRLLMEALSGSGQHAAAVQAYRDLRVLLYRELNVEPAPETQALFQQVRQDARRCAARGGPEVPDRSENRRPAPCPGSLPRPLTQTIGREDATRALEEQLAQARLLTLTGAGGVGKTRLALEVAERARCVCADGVWFADLASIQDPALVPLTIAAALGVRPEAGTAVERTLDLQLESRSLLLVLDNCEHLLDACAALAERLLGACPSVRILATSRQRLGIPGEVVWRVPSLSESAALQLFRERAAQAQPTAGWGSADTETAAEICRHLDGIPLAIELAAARVSVMPLAEIAARLDDRFRLLSYGSRTALPRQQTLQALIDWSHELLTGAERVLLRRLAVFVGGWTLEAAEAVCAAGGLREVEVLPSLAALVEKSLVFFEERDGRGWYGLLETVRQYARDRLAEAGETRALRDRHLDYYHRRCLDLAAGSFIQSARVDYDNIMAALTWCEQEERHTEVGLRLAVAESRLWWRQGHLRGGCDHLLRLLSRPPRSGAEQLRAAALNEASRLACLHGDGRLAQSLAEEGLALARQARDAILASQHLLRLAAVARARHDLSASRALGEEALEAARQSTDEAEMGRACLAISATATLLEDRATARAYGEEALQRLLGREPAGQVAMAFAGLGRVAELEEDWPQVHALFTESLRIRSGFQDRWGIPPSLEGVAAALARRGEPARAVRLLGAAEALRDRLGSSVLPEEEQLRNRCIAVLRGQLDPLDFASLWLEGRALGREGAIAAALDAPPLDTPPRDAGPGPP